MIGGILAGAMTLIALQVFGSDNSGSGGINGPARGGALLQWVSHGVQQLIDPGKALIPQVGNKQAQKPPAAPTPGNSGGGSPGQRDVNTMPRNPSAWI